MVGGTSGGAAYEHVQATPAGTWIVNHNLGFRPSVEVYDAGGVEVIAQIIHISVNQFQVIVNPAMAGVARGT